VKKQSHDAERKRILEALDARGGNQSKAAEILGISRVTLWKRLKAFDIKVDRSVRG
jgi:transcriptional regulator of acetoin/glycerol metabolism